MSAASRGPIHHRSYIGRGPRVFSEFRSYTPHKRMCRHPCPGSANVAPAPLSSMPVSGDVPRQPWLILKT